METREKKNKSRWQKPSLTILDRVRPEEHVLGSCKASVDTCKMGNRLAYQIAGS